MELTREPITSAEEVRRLAAELAERVEAEFPGVDDSEVFDTLSPELEAYFDAHNRACDELCAAVSWDVNLLCSALPAALEVGHHRPGDQLIITARLKAIHRTTGKPAAWHAGRGGLDAVRGTPSPS